MYRPYSEFCVILGVPILLRIAVPICSEFSVINKILNNEVKRLVLTHKDRLLRFGAELIFSICEAKGVEVVIINRGEDKPSFEEDLAKDVLEIITVFSARLYGSRSKKNKKLLEKIKEAAEADR